MIICQVPFRVSFAGGGTDLEAYWQHDYGAVLSVTVRRHMYVTVHRRFEPTTRVAYSRTEIVASIDDLEHDLVREAIRRTGIDEPLEITTIADVPAGTGMGSSSSLTVGLLHALYAHAGRIVSRQTLAEQACEIEIDRLGHPIGKQDQYAAAFGGMNYMRFHPNGTVDVEPVPLLPATAVALEARCMLIYAGGQRDANEILDKQSRGTADRMSVLTEMRDLAGALRLTLAGPVGDDGLDRFAELLDTGWELKRSLGFGISGAEIDELYRRARAAGAQGGKLLGAGGGGFLLLMAPADRHAAIRQALGEPQTMPFTIDRQGSRLVFISEDV